MGEPPGPWSGPCRCSCTRQAIALVLRTHTVRSTCSPTTTSPRSATRTSCAVALLGAASCGTCTSTCGVHPRRRTGSSTCRASSPQLASSASASCRSRMVRAARCASASSGVDTSRSSTRGFASTYKSSVARGSSVAWSTGSTFAAMCRSMRRLSGSTPPACAQLTVLVAPCQGQEPSAPARSCIQRRASPGECRRSCTALSRSFTICTRCRERFRLSYTSSKRSVVPSGNDTSGATPDACTDAAAASACAPAAIGPAPALCIPLAYRVAIAWQSLATLRASGDVEDEAAAHWN